MKTYLFPGQGSQHVGMGEKLFDAFPELVAAADEILNYSIRDLCLKNQDGQLVQTQFTQPALYVVNALSYRQRLAENGAPPDFVAGHSVAEYNALEVAGVISFEDGLKLVRKRGELMSTAPRGTMAAVIGLSAERISEILAENALSSIDIANYNAPTQTIISGLVDDVQNARGIFEANQAMYMPLNVSGAFHSRYMQPVQEEFSRYLDSFHFSAPGIAVIANIDALPYPSGQVAQKLAEQLTHPVRWVDSMHYLLDQGVTEFVELGPGEVLTKLIRAIRKKYTPPGTASVSALASESTPAASQAACNQATENIPAQPLPQSPAKTAQQLVSDWNKSHPVGTMVIVKGYEQPLTTKSQAVILFGHRAAIYMQGYNGYFALAEVQPAGTVAATA
jgi:malonyl CoA-acyl carrier protein transacylase